MTRKERAKELQRLVLRDAELNDELSDAERQYEAARGRMWSLKDQLDSTRKEIDYHMKELQR